MMKADHRQTVHKLVENIQTRQSTYEIQQVVELLECLLEMAKEELVTCSLENFPRVQGETQTYDKILRLLNRPSIKTLINKE